MDNTKRKDIRKGLWVDIVLKKDQGTDKRVRGQVGRILTNIKEHPRGIKVMLTDGQVGRIQHVLTKEEIRKENRRFYEKLFHLPKVYSLFDLTRQHFVVFRYTNPKTEEVERTALLFEDRGELEEFLIGTSYYIGDYMVKEIPKDTSIVNKFIPLFAEYVRVNGNRKISIDNLQELELQYRSFDEDFLI